MAALAVGFGVYVCERGSANVNVVPKWRIFPEQGIGLLGSLGYSLPTFLHAYSFVLLSAAVFTPFLVRPLLPCGMWLAIEALLELGQHERLAPWYALGIPGRLEGFQAVRSARHYFLHGTFDLCDLAAAFLGVALAYLTLRLASRRPR